MAKNLISKILAATDKGVNRTSGANGVLARLFRQMLLDLGISHSKWSTLMYDFITDVKNGVPNNKKDQTSMRGNLTKEFARPQMTWKVFCKAMRFLQICNIEIVIKARHLNGSTSLHSTSVDFGRRKDLAEFLAEVNKPDDVEDDLGAPNDLGIYAEHPENE